LEASVLDFRLTSRPKGTSTETDEMFNTLELVDSKLELVVTENYSLETVSVIQKET
jgi:hypothetical protein